MNTKQQFKEHLKEQVMNRFKDRAIPQDSKGSKLIASIVKSVLRELKENNEISKIPFFQVFTEDKLKEDKGVTSPEGIDNLIPLGKEEGLGYQNIIIRGGDLEEAVGSGPGEPLSVEEAKELNPEQIRDKFVVLQGGA